MQVQKDYIRHTIIENAIDEFYNYGFQKASLRKIVTKSRTASSNFYNYFDNKEELFDVIVMPAYEKLLHLIKQDEKDAEDLNEMIKYDIESIRNMINSEFDGIDDQTAKSLIILIDGSKGTKYEGVKETIYDMLTQHILIHIKKLANDITQYHHEISKILAKSFLEGILGILRQPLEFSVKKELFIDLSLVFAVGSTVFTRLREDNIKNYNY